MSKRTITAITGLIASIAIVVIGVTSNLSGHDADFWNFMPIYIAVMVSTGDWPNRKNCHLNFWHKKEQKQ